MIRKMIPIILIIFLVSDEAASESTLGLNEVSVTCPSIPDCDFIELKQLSTVNKGVMLLNSYSVYGIGLNPNNGSPYYEIDLTVTLNNFATNEQGLFTIGMKNAPGPMMLESSNDLVQWKRKVLTGQDIDMIPDADKHPRALVVVRSNSPLMLSKTQPSIPFTQKLIKQLKDEMVDAMVYTNQSPGDSCSFFENLFLNLTKSDLMVRENDNGTSIDTSSSRCSSTIENFNSNFYEWTNTTALKENDCSGLKFDLHILITALVSGNDSEDDSQVHDCKSYYPTEMIRSIDPNHIEQVFMNHTSDDTCPWIAPEVLRRKFDIDEKIAILKKLNSSLLGGDDDDMLDPWESDRYFNNDWIQTIGTNEYLKQRLDVNWFTNKSVRKWFALNFDSADPSKSTYQCRICNGYKDFDRSTKPQLADPIHFHNERRINRRNIDGHDKLSGHNQAISALQNGFYQIIDGLMLKTGDDHPQMQATINLMRTIYGEIKMNVPPLSHPTMHDLISQFGVNIGTHFASERSARRITEMISEYFHELLIKFIKENDSPITIIMDSSSDLAMHHTMIVYLQLVESNRPVVMFYRLIELGSDGKAATIVKHLMDCFLADGILDRMKLLLKGFSSDGENLMLGSRGGVAAILETEIGSRLYKIHCAAHRLNLMAANGLKTKNGVLEQLETFMNRIYAYYHASPKRVNQLKELAEDLGVDFVMLAQYKKVRWSAAELAVMKKVLATWKILIVDMDTTIADPQTSESVKNDLRYLVSLLKNKNVILYLHFFEDVLTDLNEYSLIFQQKIPLVIGKFSLLREMRKKFETISSRPLPKMNKFVSGCTCNSVRCSTVIDYIRSENVVCFGVSLNNELFAEDFRTFHQAASSKLIQQFDLYYPEQSMEMFQALDPESIPSTDEEKRSFGDEWIGIIANKFQFGPSVVLEWQALRDRIFADPDLCQVKQSGPVAFWKHYLDLSGSENKEIASLIRTVLSLSFSSAEAERGFSIVKWLRSGRHSLTVKNLEHRLRIHLNGPDKLAAFPATAVARKWIDKHMRADDPYPKRESATKDDILQRLPQNTIIYQHVARDIQSPQPTTRTLSYREKHCLAFQQICPALMRLIGPTWILCADKMRECNLELLV